MSQTWRWPNTERERGSNDGDYRSDEGDILQGHEQVHPKADLKRKKAQEEEKRSGFGRSGVKSLLW